MIHRCCTFAFLALIEMMHDLVLPAAEPVAPARPLDATQVHARIRDILAEQRAKQHIPGLAFVAVKDDKVLFIETFGLRDVGRKLPVTPETVLASTSKPVMARLVG